MKTITWIGGGLAVAAVVLVAIVSTTGDENAQGDPYQQVLSECLDSPSAAATADGANMGKTDWCKMLAFRVATAKACVDDPGNTQACERSDLAEKLTRGDQ